MKFQILFSGKNKKNMSTICCLLNWPRDWQRLIKIMFFKKFKIKQRAIDIKVKDYPLLTKKAVKVEDSHP